MLPVDECVQVAKPPPLGFAAVLLREGIPVSDIRRRQHRLLTKLAKVNVPPVQGTQDALRVWLGFCRTGSHVATWACGDKGLAWMRSRDPIKLSRALIQGLGFGSFRASCSTGKGDRVAENSDIYTTAQHSYSNGSGSLTDMALKD